MVIDLAGERRFFFLQEIPFCLEHVKAPLKAGNELFLAFDELALIEQTGPNENPKA